MVNVFQAERDALVEDKRKQRIEINDLKKQVRDLQREHDTSESLRAELYKLSSLEARPIPWMERVKRGSRGVVSVPVAFWSDWHLGEVVFKEQVGGVNEFNKAIARQRVKRLVEVTIDLAKNHMGQMQYPGIVVPLGGDMISGNIHEELRETNEGTVLQTVQFGFDLLSWALARLADEFGKVFVPCVVGNHGRTKHKPHAKNRAFENYEWSLYMQLARHFKDDKRLTFMIPDGPDAPFNVLGHRFLLTHGDSLGVKGGDGIIGAIGPIVRGAVKFGRQKGVIGQDFDTLMMGHWHTYIPRGEAAPVWVNGTLKGFDEFAHTFLRAPSSRPSQSLAFVHADHGITAQWQVYLEGQQKAERDSDRWLTFDGGTNG